MTLASQHFQSPASGGTISGLISSNSCLFRRNCFEQAGPIRVTQLLTCLPSSPRAKATRGRGRALGSPRRVLTEKLINFQDGLGHFFDVHGPPLGGARTKPRMRDRPADPHSNARYIRFDARTVFGCRCVTCLPAGPVWCVTMRHKGNFFLPPPPPFGFFGAFFINRFGSSRQPPCRQRPASLKERLPRPTCVDLAALERPKEVRPSRLRLFSHPSAFSTTRPFEYWRAVATQKGFCLNISWMS